MLIPIRPTNHTALEPVDADGALERVKELAKLYRLAEMPPR